MEPFFGHDFSQVRIHADDEAAQSAAGIRAAAFTLGQDIVFGAGRYRPNSGNGASLLAHELTHVIQQSGTITETSRQVGGAEVRQSTQTPESEASDIAAQVFDSSTTFGGLPALAPVSVRNSVGPGIQRAVDTQAEQEQLAPRSQHYNPWESIVAGASSDRATLTESPVALEYAWFIDANREDLKAWREFREGNYDLLPMPGVRSANAALDLKKSLQTKARGRVSQSDVTAQMRRRYSDQELAELSGIARWAGTIPNVRGAAALGDLLGVSTRPTKHTYEFNIRWDWSIGAGVDGGDGNSDAPSPIGTVERDWGSPISVGAVARAARVRYSNPELGMGFTVNLDIYSGKLGASLSRGASVSSGQSSEVNVDFDQVPPGGKEIINSIRGVEEEWLPAAAAPATFWRPTDFAGSFSVFSGKVSATTQVGAWSFKPVSATFFELFSFSKGSELLVFAVPGASEDGERKANDAEESRKRLVDALVDMEATTDRSKLAEVAAGAGLEFEYGRAFIDDVEYEATAPEFDARDRKQGWFLLRETDLYFDTGSHKVTDDPANLNEIRELAAYIGRYAKVHPDADFSFKITGYSSPAWGGTRDPESASSKNFDLSQLRASSVQAAMVAYKSEMIESGAKECYFEIRYEDLEGLNQSIYDPDIDQQVGAMGSDPAIQEGKALDSNDPEDRRVHIETYVQLDITDWI